MHLQTLEDQFGESYTEAQRIRHLFNKLRPQLRNLLAAQAELPRTRIELVSLATRLEMTARKAQSSGKRDFELGPTDDTNKRRKRQAYASKTRPSVDSRSNSQQPPARSSANRVAVRGGPHKAPRANIVCYECGQQGHIRPKCPKLSGSGAQSS